MQWQTFTTIGFPVPLCFRITFKGRIDRRKDSWTDRRARRVMRLLGRPHAANSRPAISVRHLHGSATCIWQVVHFRSPLSTYLEMWRFRPIRRDSPHCRPSPASCRCNGTCWYTGSECSDISSLLHQRTQFFTLVTAGSQAASHNNPYIQAAYVSVTVCVWDCPRVCLSVVSEQRSCLTVAPVGTWMGNCL